MADGQPSKLRKTYIWALRPSSEQILEIPLVATTHNSDQLYRNSENKKNDDFDSDE
jgi:hypothetical protein